MKKLYIIIFSLIVTITYSQERTDIGKYFEFTDDISIYEAVKVPKGKNPTTSDIKDDTFVLNGDTIIVKKKWVFKIFTIQDGLYIITVANEDSAVTGKYFALTVQQKQLNTQSLRGDIRDVGFVSSAITIPVKIRFGDRSKGSSIENENGNRRRFSDFEGNVNVGAAAGFRIKVSNTGFDFINILGGINIGATNINSDTAEVQTETNAGILTPFLGAVYEYKDFELGLFYGWDHISGSVGRTWVYQGKPWLGVGIGYKVFGTQPSTTVERNKQERKDKREAKKAQRGAAKK